MIPLNNQILSPQNLKRIQQQAPVVANIVLLLALSYALAQLTWLFFKPAPNIAKPAPTSITTTSRPDNTNNSQKLITINNAYLFGKVEKAAPKQVIEDAPETSLNLVLRGILSADPMSLATVIIAQGKNSAEQVYGMGDSVPGNATIEAIHADRVILMRNGRHETLKLPEKSIGDASFREANANMARFPGSAGAAPGKVLGDIRRKIMKDPTSFGEYAIPVPVSKNGKLQGYRLRPTGKGREMFAQFGLQESDVISKINGISLNNPTQGISALRRLSRANSVNLTVIRNGAEIPLNFDLR